MTLSSIIILPPASWRGGAMFLRMKENSASSITTVDLCLHVAVIKGELREALLSTSANCRRWGEGWVAKQRMVTLTGSENRNPAVWTKHPSNPKPSVIHRRGEEVPVGSVSRSIHWMRRENTSKWTIQFKTLFCPDKYTQSEILQNTSASLLK